MPAPIRPRRSLLYMPGSNPRALEKARALPADGLIFDLEDAVAPDAKEGARSIVAAALAAGGYGWRECVLRVNPLDSPWGHGDLAAAATMPIGAVLLPKVESPDRVCLAVSLLDALGAPDNLAIWCMLETPLGVLAAREIAGASPRLAALVVGTSEPGSSRRSYLIPIAGQPLDRHATEQTLSKVEQPGSVEAPRLGIGTDCGTFRQSRWRRAAGGLRPRRRLGDFKGAERSQSGVDRGHDRRLPILRFGFETKGRLCRVCPWISKARSNSQDRR